MLSPLRLVWSFWFFYLHVLNNHPISHFLCYFISNAPSAVKHIAKISFRDVKELSRLFFISKLSDKLTEFLKHLAWCHPSFSPFCASQSLKLIDVRVTSPKLFIESSKASWPALQASSRAAASSFSAKVALVCQNVAASCSFASPFSSFSFSASSLSLTKFNLVISSNNSFTLLSFSAFRVAISDSYLLFLSRISSNLSLISLLS